MLTYLVPKVNTLGKAQETSGPFMMICLEEWKEMEDLECVCFCSGKCASQYFCACSVQQVLSVWGKSLCSWVEIPLGCTYKPHSGWLTLLLGYRLVGVHTSWLPVFSLKLTLIVSPWHELWQGLPFKKRERPVPRNWVRKGRKEK